MQEQKTRYVMPADYFQTMVDKLPRETRDLYYELGHIRQELTAQGKQFAVYQCDEDGEPDLLDILTVKKLDMTHEDGLWATIRSRQYREMQIIDYTPVELFDYNSMMFMPLSTTVRWSVTNPEADHGSVAFTVVIRTMSRAHLREPGITYVETMSQFRREFGKQALMA